jgi:L-seryl-tRNA(Ser) seleniumtransferase
MRENLTHMNRWSDHMTGRRAFIKGMSAFPAAAVFPLLEAESKSLAGRDYYREIGVKPFINAAAAYSALGGRNMWPAVVEAMEYARKRNVIMEELLGAVGKRIASLVGCEAAMVTSGATGAMILGTAACLTGKDEERIRRY